MSYNIGNPTLITTTDVQTLFGKTYVSPIFSGIPTDPYYPLFEAHTLSDQKDITGDGTIYTSIFDIVDVDQGSNYDSGAGKFSCPVDGNYVFSTNLRPYTISSSITNCEIRIYNETEGRYIGANQFNYNVVKNVDDKVTICVSGQGFCLAGDKVCVQFTASGDSFLSTGISSEPEYITKFCGYLLF